MKEGSVGLGKSGDPQGSGQNGANNEEDSVSHGKSGGSLRSQPGTLKEGSVGHGKSGSSQESGQNGNQTNENIYESLPLPGDPGNEDAISPGHPGGN